MWHDLRHGPQGSDNGRMDLDELAISAPPVHGRLPSTWLLLLLRSCVSCCRLAAVAGATTRRQRPATAGQTRTRRLCGRTRALGTCARAVVKLHIAIMLVMLPLQRLLLSNHPHLALDFQRLTLCL